MNLHQIAKRLLSGSLDLDDAIDAVADITRLTSKKKTRQRPGNVPSAEALSQPGLTHEEGLLRWFATDCAQRALSREEASQRRPPPVAYEAIETARKAILGETALDRLEQVADSLKTATFATDDSRYEDDDLPSITLQEMAWLSARDALVAMLKGPSCRDAAKQTSLESANEAAWTASFRPEARQNKRRAWAHAQGSEFSWQCYRLAYLCEVWATCGARAPQLLFHDTCPLPAPHEALLDPS